MPVISWMGALRPWSRTGLVALVAGLAVGACAGRSPRVSDPPVPAPAPADVAWSLYLIGDAGAPDPTDPVLAVMGEMMARAPDRSTAVFLGDNIYPLGLGDPADPRRARDSVRLLIQVRAVTDAGSRGIFVPGNHDWEKGGPGGLAAIRRQGEWLARHGGGRAELLPANGCPGPVASDLGEAFRVIALDTQWWLHAHERPGPAECPFGTEEAVTAELARLSAEGRAAGRQVVVAAHHPLETGGPHGGKFGIDKHLFPLKEVFEWGAFVPLPVIGSIYPFARAGGISRQDVGNGMYRAMRAALEDAIRPSHPLVWAGGHDHNLQVLEGRGSTRWQIVSGSGYYGHGAHAGWLARTRYASDHSGFVRLDALADGRIRAAVIEVNERGEWHEAWSSWME